MSSDVLPRPARRAGKAFAWALAALALAAVAFVVWIGIRGLLAYQHLEAARGGIERASANITEPDAAAADIRTASEEARAAASLTSDPVWKAAEGLPWVGPQLAAVGTVSAAVAGVADSVLEPLSEVASGFSIDSLRLVDGALDLSVFEALREPATEASRGLDTAAEKLAGIDRAPLLRSVRQGLDEATGKLSTAVAAAGALERVTTLLPAMLGGSEPRTWLLLFQNPAELRSLGGMPGATAVIAADGGRVQLVGQGTAAIPRFPEPVLPLDPEVQGVFGERPAVWFSGTTILPDFATAAPLAREMWNRAHGTLADGVISVDPIALSYLLKATGPVQLPTGETLTSDNAVSFLLNQVYIDYPDPVAQNAVFASAAATVFDALASGRAEPAALVSALTQAGEERRLLLWSSDPDEERMLSETTLSGPLPTTDADTARFGVYLNDGTGSKLGYYLQVDPTLEWGNCAEPGDAARRVTLTVTMHNKAPLDAATSLPDDIVGGNYGVPAGVLRVVGYIYLPLGSTLVDAEATLAPGFGGGMQGGYRVLSFPADIAPGETSTVTVTVDLGDPLPDEVTALITPAFGATSVTAACADAER
ncbi:DUF4012 domain-containing protein [Microbacterium sp. NPDC019599]|uniref:DUF4012 domain-containing protein n=1 Tax=Microbacterium sp. NPDC019599 TaxID=3154690 RepID=UPI0033F7C942